MKHIAIYLLIFTFAGSVFAQNKGFKYGARFGIGQANISKADIQNQIGKLALNAGITAAYHFTNYFALTTEILYVSKGVRATGTVLGSGLTGSKSYNYEEAYKLSYIEIPGMAKFSIGGKTFRFKVFAGPSMNFNISGNHSRIFEDLDYDLDNGFYDKKIPGLKVLEYSGVVGAGFEAMKQADIFFIDIRYNSAFNSLGMINGRNAYNNYFAVGIGYTH